MNAATTILRLQPVCDRRTCNACTEPGADRIAYRMHWRDAGRVWRCEICYPFRVEHAHEPVAAATPLAAVVTPTVEHVEASPGDRSAVGALHSDLDAIIETVAELRRRIDAQDKRIRALSEMVASK